MRTAITLKRNGFLLLVLGIQPVLTTLDRIAQVILYNTPIGDGFGLMTLLAGFVRVKGNILYETLLDGDSIRAVAIGFGTIREKYTTTTSVLMVVSKIEGTKVRLLRLGHVASNQILRTELST